MYAGIFLLEISEYSNLHHLLLHLFPDPGHPEELGGPDLLHVLDEGAAKGVLVWGPIQ